MSFDPDVTPETPSPYATPRSDFENFAGQLGAPLKPAKDSEQRGSPALVLLGWLVILACCVFIFIGQQVNPPVKERGASKADLMQANFMAKVWVGMANFTSTQQAVEAIQKSENTGPLEFRLCNAILTNELLDANQAMEQIEELDELIDATDYRPSEKQARLIETIRHLMTDYQANHWQAPSVSSDDRKFLEDSLGFCGKLALLPNASDDQAARSRLIQRAQITTVLLLLVGGAVLSMFIGGLVCATIFAARMLSGKTQWRFQTNTHRGRIYVEAFSVWMVCFLAFSIAAAVVMKSMAVDANDLPPLVTSAIGLVVFLLTLIPAGFPLLRGVTASEFRKDIGWTVDVSVVLGTLREIGAGIFAYLANLPVMILAFGAFIGLSTIQEQFTTPGHELDFPSSGAHPIVDEIVAGNPLVILVLFLTAAVAAPLVEETVFRGILYRHLREGSRRLPRLLSALSSALIGCFLFAVIHPQSWVAIPMLMGLAFGFTWAREWRDSLIAPITMHALNNGLVTALMIVMLV